MMKGRTLIVQANESMDNRTFPEYDKRFRMVNKSKVMFNLTSPFASVGFISPPAHFPQLHLAHRKKGARKAEEAV